MFDFDHMLLFQQTGVISSQASTACLPFLPVNPEYGTSRNQARQKLARLDRVEFAQLVTDVLKGSTM